jgi:hypothetical protein
MRTLDLIAEADSLPLQHKLILLWQCITQILTFWAQAVPATALKAWDKVLVGQVGAIVDVNLVLYLFHMAVAHVPAQLGRLGLCTMSETVLCALVASILFAAVLA